mmetsp:Transcript_26777/g.58793  ORF Transcript_26777/g.58793 Transcript_26777/m.58793 type:complete len:205 (+) Transcript_26777:215-829(+)|eukprot:6172571-Pleurochrysis_carterae.AAC.1
MNSSDVSAQKPGALAVLFHTVRMATTGLVKTQSSIDPQWRMILANPFSVYATSSFAYSLAGALALMQTMSCPCILPGWPYRLCCVESLLVIQQGLLSYWADALRIGLKSVAHPIDRVSAVTLTALQLFKYSICIEMSPAERIWIWAALLAALSMKVLGYYAILSRNVYLFRDAHTLWHLSLPIAVAVFNTWRWMQCTHISCDEA